MGAVFTIFLLTPLFIPVLIVNFIIEKFTGITPEEQFEIFSEAVTKWMAENPETVAKIGEFIKEAVGFIIEIAEKS